MGATKIELLGVLPQLVLTEAEPEPIYRFSSKDSTHITPKADNAYDLGGNRKVPVKMFLKDGKWVGVGGVSVPIWR